MSEGRSRAKQKRADEETQKEKQIHQDEEKRW